MGGAVSSGRDNGELVDNLKSSNYIRTPKVEAVFRAVDRGDYMPSAARDLAYKDLAWKEGQLHLSAPCIYSEVMEALELSEGLTFLNVGSGTGYLSTMVGLLLGAQGINHGIELHQYVLAYAAKRLAEFITTSSAVDEFDFCVPTFVQGNGLCLPPALMRYDRVYCGAACPEQFTTYFKHLIKVGGVLVMPLNDSLIQVRRESETTWSQRSLLSVSFASLYEPTKDTQRPQELPVAPCRLQVIARSVIRRSVQGSVLLRHPALREPPPPRPPTAKKRCTRRICIPIEDDSDMDLNALHDIEDRASGTDEMNALLSLVLSMGQSRAAGALRIDTDSDHDSSGSSDSSDTSRDSIYSDGSRDVGRRHSEDGSLGRRHSGEDVSHDVGPRRSGEDDSLGPRQSGEDNSLGPRHSGEDDSHDVGPRHSGEDGSHDIGPRRSGEDYSHYVGPRHSEDGSHDVGPRHSGEDGSHDIVPRRSGEDYSHDVGPRHSGEDSVLDNLSQAMSDGSEMQTIPLDTPREPLAEELEGEASKSRGDESKPGSSKTGSPETETSDEVGGERRRGRSKRSKLDSGIGENSPEGGAGEGESPPSGGRDTPVEIFMRRRQHKRSRPSSPSSSSSSSDSSESPPRRSRKRRGTPDPHRTRRDSISLHMQRAIAALPLPRPLRVYLNLDRPLPDARRPSVAC